MKKGSWSLEESAVERRPLASRRIVAFGMSEKSLVVSSLVGFGLVMFLSLGIMAEPLPLESTPLELGVGVRLVGPSISLVYRGGVELTSTDKRFGGLSGLIVSRDRQEVLAVSDRGWWVSGQLRHDTKGNLVALEKANIYRMQASPANDDPRTFSLDAEALVRSGENSFVVAFEQQHRLWEYPGLFSPPIPIDMPEKITDLPRNSGIESLVRLQNGKLLAIAEGGIREKEFLGFLFTKSGVVEFFYPYDDYFRPSDAALYSEGVVLVLERGYNNDVGVAARLMLLRLEKAGDSISMSTTLAVDLGNPIPMDNFEGMAFLQEESSQAILYILSDDNYSPSQRTLLVMFELEISD